MKGLASGELVTSSIRLIRELGQGGMGSVWLAEHLRLRVQVVIKFIASEHLASAEAVSRFEREASLAAQAKSPHVVQVFDHGVADNGLPYIAMELLEGEDLGARIQRSGRIPPEVFADWLSQACRGVAKAHGKGIVHRDIKPENLFLCENDGDILVKVLDFGIAKSSVAGFDSTKTGAMLGTAYYMSPEQTMGLKTVDHRTDLWALGVVTFLAITGARPFDGDAIGALVLAITTGPIAAPSSIVRSLPLAVDAWMAKALSRDPATRFASAREMADAFHSAVHGGPVRASSSDPPKQLGPGFTVQMPWVDTGPPPGPRTSSPSGPQGTRLLSNSTMTPSISTNAAGLTGPVPARTNAASAIIAVAAVVSIALLLLGGRALLHWRSTSALSPATASVGTTAAPESVPPPTDATAVVAAPPLGQHAAAPPTGRADAPAAKHGPPTVIRPATPTEPAATAAAVASATATVDHPAAPAPELRKTPASPAPNPPPAASHTSPLKMPLE